MCLEGIKSFFFFYQSVPFAPDKRIRRHAMQLVSCWMQQMASFASPRRTCRSVSRQPAVLALNTCRRTVARAWGVVQGRFMLSNCSWLPVGLSVYYQAKHNTTLAILCMCRFAFQADESLFCVCWHRPVHKEFMMVDRKVGTGTA